MSNTNNKPDKKPLQRSILGINYAWNGIVYFFRTQQNGRIQVIVALLAILFGYLLEISYSEWLIVIVSIAMVLATEMINTAIEYLTDIVSPDYDIKAGRIKDIAAGAVLITAIGAAIAGSWIFIPRVIELIFGKLTWIG